MNPRIALQKDFELIEFIGRGVSSEVYKGLRVDSNSDFSQVVAIKIFKSSKFRKKYQNELKNLSKINHPNIISVRDWGEVDQKFYLITEYVHGCDLSEVMSLLSAQNEKLKKYILNQIFQGVQALKNKGIAHGDLKPSNIMLSVTGEVKLVDISFDDIGQMFATPEFAAPELLSGQRSNFESDLYSLGVIAEKLNVFQKNLLALEPGDRSYDSFKGLKEPEEKSKLSYLVRDTLLKNNLPVETYPITQELHAPVQPYFSISSKSFAQNTKRISRQMWPHLLLLLILGFDLAPQFPEVKTLKLRSLNAYEFWNDKEWVSLPINHNFFFRTQNEKKKLKFRTHKGEVSLIFRGDMDFNKNIIVDTY